MDRHELDALRLIANRNIQKIMDALGIVYEERYQYIVAPCPIHNGDRKDGFSWHIDFGMFQCFSRGCHDKVGKDVYGLVKGVLDTSFPETIDFIKNICIQADGSLDLSNSKQLVDTKKFVDQVKVKEKPLRIYPEESLKYLRYHSYLEGRGYPKDLAELYQVGVTDAKYKRMSNRLIFPVRNIDGSIVGFTGRTLNPNWKQAGIGKWQHSDGFDKEHNLFNIHRAHEEIERTGCAILVEGALDVLRLEQAGIRNSVAIFGRKLHNGQIALLLSLGVSKIILALDADIAGVTGATKAEKAAQSYFKVVNFCPEGSKDIGEMTVEKLREHFAEKTETLTSVGN